MEVQTLGYVKTQDGQAKHMSKIKVHADNGNDCADVMDNKASNSQCCIISKSLAMQDISI